MRPKQQQTTGSSDLFWARLDQIINLKHELVLLAGKIDWTQIDGEVAPLYSENGRPGIQTRFMIGPAVAGSTFTGCPMRGCGSAGSTTRISNSLPAKQNSQHAFPHERSDLSHRRKRLGDRLELLLAESLRVAHAAGALRGQDLKPGHGRYHGAAEGHHLSDRCAAAACGHQRAQSPGEKARRRVATILFSRGQGRRDDGGPLRPCQTVQAASAAVAYPAQSAGPDHPRHPPGDRGPACTAGGVRPPAWSGHADPLATAAPARLELYSFHAPEVECIGKGKAAAPYEFLVKASIVTNNRLAPEAVRAARQGAAR